MIGISAGLASEGFSPYTYSIGIFPTFRCAEQIRNDIDYHNLPVVICTVGSGVAYGNLGYSHHAIQDISLMRSLPHMLIATPCDPQEVVSILNWHYANPCPLYLRLHKSGEPNLSSPDSSLFPGKLRRIWPINSSNSDHKSDYCILVVGHIASRVVEIVNQLSSGVPVFSCPLWSSKYGKVLSSQLSEFSTVITVEDHVLSGGFGSWILELVASNDLDIRVIPFALDIDVIGSVANENTLLQSLLTKLSDLLIKFGN